MAIVKGGVIHTHIASNMPRIRDFEVSQSAQTQLPDTRVSADDFGRQIGGAVNAWAVRLDKASM